MSPYYRKCEACGHVEPVAWRGGRFNIDWEIADWGEFERAYPEIASKVVRPGEKNAVICGDFVYWRQRSKGGFPGRFIHRIPFSIYKANGHSCRGQGTYQESHRYRDLAGNERLVVA